MINGAKLLQDLNARAINGVKYLKNDFMCSLTRD
jgi:hypothetical protein